MNMLAVLSLLAFSMYLHIGIYVSKFNGKSDFNVLIFILCISMAIWSFAYAFVYITAGRESMIWQGIAFMGWCYIYATEIHSLMLFIGNKNIKRSYVKILIYLPGSIFLLIRMFLFKSYEIENKFYYAMFIYGFIYSIVTFVLLYKWIKGVKTLREKKQGRIIIITGSISYILMQVSQVCSQKYNVPNMGQLFNLILIIGIFYTSIRYSLFEVLPELIIEEVLSEMMDIVIVISHEGKILKVNKHMKSLFGYNGEDIIDKPFNMFVKDKELINHIINQGNNLKQQVYSQLDCIGKSGEIIPFSISYSPIRDIKLNELLGIIIVGHDIRETKRLEQEILEHKKSEQQFNQSEERFRLMFYKNTAVMYLIDPKTLDIFDANESAVKFYGYTKEEIRKMKITDLNGLSYEEAKKILSQSAIKYKNFYHYKHKLANGEIKDVEVYSTLIPIKDKQMIYSIVIDITNRKKAEEYISFLAYHDSLTGLPNRKLFNEKVKEEIYISAINKRRFAILYIDLDGFKLINDNFGHSTGDFLLYEVGVRIKDCIRKDDILARIGGDEFTLLVSDIQRYKDVELITKKISKALERPIIKDNQELIIQASIGISIYPQNGQDIKTLLEIADFNMYKQKEKKSINIIKDPRHLL